MMMMRREMERRRRRDLETLAEARGLIGAPRGLLLEGVHPPVDPYQQLLHLRRRPVRAHLLRRRLRPHRFRRRSARAPPRLSRGGPIRPETGLSCAASSTPQHGGRADGGTRAWREEGGGEAWGEEEWWDLLGEMLDFRLQHSDQRAVLLTLQSRRHLARFVRGPRPPPFPGA